MQYPQIRTASLSFSVCSFRNHCSVPSNQDSFIVIQCVCSFRSHCAVPSNQDSFPVFVFIQEPLCSASNQDSFPVTQCVCSFMNHCAVSSNQDSFPDIQLVCSFRNHCVVPLNQDSFPATNVYSFRSHCAIPSNRDSFPVIQCLRSFRNRCAVPSKQDSLAAIQCMFIQEPLRGTLKARQLPCVCAHSGTVVQCPQIKTASLPFNVRLFRNPKDCAEGCRSKGTETCFIFLASVLCSVIGRHLLSGLTRDICWQGDAETAPRLPSQRGKGSV